jgi:hypothetical protein
VGEVLFVKKNKGDRKALTHDIYLLSTSFVDKTITPKNY